MSHIVPVYILSGFLGSGKTTLLKRAMDYYKKQGKRPAIIMNEIGDINLEKVGLDPNIPMSEMLSGCICCSIRGDLGITLKEIVEEEQPDVIWIEATGAANPMEIFEGVTEASMFVKLELKSMVTVVDAKHLWDQMQKAKGKTFKLMQEQIKCASKLLINKMDLIDESSIPLIEQTLAEWNPYAKQEWTVHCETDIAKLAEQKIDKDMLTKGSDEHKHESDDHHHSHNHVMAYTHYLEHAVDRIAFHQMMGKIPKSVYRGKGIVQFTDGPERYLFQYAYHEMEFTKIDPQLEVPDVLVFIGEHFPKEQLKEVVQKIQF